MSRLFIALSYIQNFLIRFQLWYVYILSGQYTLNHIAKKWRKNIHDRIGRSNIKNRCYITWYPFWMWDWNWTKYIVSRRISIESSQIYPSEWCMFVGSMARKSVNMIVPDEETMYFFLTQGYRYRFNLSYHFECIWKWIQRIYSINGNNIVNDGARSELKTIKNFF